MSKVNQETIYDLLYVFHINFSYNMHLLVQIDHKSPNLTFLAFEMTFRVTAPHLYFTTALTSLQWSYMDIGARKLGSTSVLLNNLYKYVKKAKSDLSDLEKGPLERFKQTCIVAVHEYPSWAALCKNREKVTEQQMASKCKKGQIWPRPWKMTFRAIKLNISFDMWFMSPQRSSMPKKLLGHFWEINL